MNERSFALSGWTIPDEHSTRCGTRGPELFAQTLWRWGEPGKGTVLEDVEDRCLLCLAERVERMLGHGWGLSGERFTRIAKR